MSETPKKKRKAPPHAFKKGNNANPLGAKAHDPEKRDAKRLTREAVAEMSNLIITGDIDQLKTIANDKKATVIRVWIARAAVKAIDKGDLSTLDSLLGRILGPEIKRVQISGDAENPLAVQAVRININIPPNGRNAVLPPEPPPIVIEKKQDES